MQAFHQPLAAASSHPGWHGLLWRCCSLHKGRTQTGGSLSVLELRNGGLQNLRIFLKRMLLPVNSALRQRAWIYSLVLRMGFGSVMQSFCFVLFLAERKNLILEPWTVVWQTESLCISVKVVNPQAETTAWDMFFCKFTFMFVDSILN